MAFKELKGYAAEIFLDKQVEQLAAIYGKAKRDLILKIRDLATTDKARYRAMQLLAQVNAEIAGLNRVIRKWSEINGKRAYDYGLNIAQERLRALDITRFVNFDARIHVGAVNVLVDQLTIDLLGANDSMQKNITRFIRSTQQKIIEDTQISRMVAQGIIEGQTRRNISDRIYDEFQKRLTDGRLIVINGRNYDPEAYSKMVARTRFMEASNQASVNSALQYGLDLVQVSVHSGACPICQPFQGKIYSISGADKDFPLLDQRPPYHPHCRHVLLPINRESLEERGLLSGSIRYSNSDSQLGVKNFREFEGLIK